MAWRYERRSEPLPRAYVAQAVLPLRAGSSRYCAEGARVAFCAQLRRLILASHAYCPHPPPPPATAFCLLIASSLHCRVSAWALGEGRRAPAEGARVW